MTVPSPARIARAVGHRIGVRRERLSAAVRRRADAAEGRLLARAGRVGVPPRLWPPAVADVRGLPVPLPPAPTLLRWLGLVSTPTPDGGLGDPRVLLVVLLHADTGTRGRLEAELRGRRRGLLRTVLAVPAADAPALAGLGDVHVRVVPVPDDPARRAELVRLAGAVALGDGTDAADAEAWRELAGACHRPVLSGLTAGEPYPVDLGDEEARRSAGRAGRLAAPLAAGQEAPPPSAALPRVTHEPRRVLVAGHDLKFAQGLLERLRADGHEVRTDAWSGHARHNVESSRAGAAWADVVLCEWMLGNAVWYSRHLPADTRLVTRAHLQEVATGFPARVRHRNVDAVLAVAEHVRAQLVRDHGVPADRARVVPNAVSVPTTAPASGADRTRVLGYVGMLPRRKGLHAALDVLERLRAEDGRYTLRVRGKTPDDVAWMGVRAAERDYYREQLGRARQGRSADAVRLDAFGADMAAWYGQVGAALSTSDFESFHFTLPDAALAGAVPRGLAWPGADLLYPRDWLAADADGLAARVRAATADEDTRARLAAEAAEHVRSRYAEEVVLPQLVDAVLGAR